MQQFTVPQFIDVEDKIIGPITVRQFIIMLSGFIIAAIFYKVFDFSAFITFGFLILIIAGIFSFARINGMPFHFFVFNFVQTAKRSPLRVWDNTLGRSASEYEEFEKTMAEEKPTATARRFTTSRLTELSLIVDTRGAYRGEERNGESVLTVEEEGGSKK